MSLIIDKNESILVCEKLIQAGRLPERNEIVILPGGYILLDEDGIITDIDELGKQIGHNIICG